jgi:fructose-1,6-bisphosphatase I
MVSDIHRILLKGGVFLYPPTVKNPEGKLRLMYEASPMAMVIEQAGGRAVAGPRPDNDGSPATTGAQLARRILDIQPTSIHERTSLIIGSPREVDAVLRHWT